MLISENTLYTNATEKDALLKDQERIMDALVFNFLGFLGLFKMNSRRGFMLTYEQTEGKLFVNHIEDSNHDVSISVKLAYDAKLITLDTVNRMTKLLVLIKQKKVTDANLDEVIVRSIIDGVKYQAHRPSSLVFNILNRFHTGAYSLEKTASELWDISRRKDYIGITTEFRDIVVKGQYQPLFSKFSKTAPVAAPIPAKVLPPIPAAIPPVIKKIANPPPVYSATNLPTPTVQPPNIPFPTIKKEIVPPPPVVKKDFILTPFQWEQILSLKSVTEVDDALTKLGGSFDEIDPLDIVLRLATHRNHTFRYQSGNPPLAQLIVRRAVRTHDFNVVVLNQIMGAWVHNLISWMRPAFQFSTIDTKVLFDILLSTKHNFLDKLGYIPPELTDTRDVVWLVKKWVDTISNERKTTGEMLPLFLNLKEAIKIFIAGKDFGTPSMLFKYNLLDVKEGFTNKMMNLITLDPAFVLSLGDATKTAMVNHFFGRGIIQVKGPTFVITDAQFFAASVEGKAIANDLKDLGVITINPTSDNARSDILANLLRDGLSSNTSANYSMYTVGRNVKDLVTVGDKILGKDSWRNVTDADIEETAKKLGNSIDPFLEKVVFGFRDYDPNIPTWDVLTKLALIRYDFFANDKNYNTAIISMLTTGAWTDIATRAKFFAKIRLESLRRDLAEFTNDWAAWSLANIPELNKIIALTNSSAKDRLDTNSLMDVNRFLYLQKEKDKDRGVDLVMYNNKEDAAFFINYVLTIPRIAGLEKMRTDFFPTLYEKFPELKEAVTKHFEKMTEEEFRYGDEMSMKLVYLTDDMITDNIMAHFKRAIEIPVKRSYSMTSPIYPTTLKDAATSKKLSAVFVDIADKVISNDERNVSRISSLSQTYSTLSFNTIIQDASSKNVADFLKRYNTFQEIILAKVKEVDPAYPILPKYVLFSVQFMEDLASKPGFAKIVDAETLAKWCNNVDAEIESDKKYYKTDYRDRAKVAIAQLFTNLQDEGREDAAEDAYDLLTSRVKKGIINDMMKYKFIDAAKVSLQTGIIKPDFTIDHNRMTQVFKYNKIEIPTLDLRKYKTYRDIKNFGSRELGLVPLAVTQVIPPTSDYLEKRSVEFDFFNKYKHGARAFVFLKEFNVDLEIQRKGMLKFIDSHPTTQAMDPVFHGTGTLAASMILRYGFKVISDNDKSVTGRMLGNGIYFSTVLDKVGQYMVDGQMSRNVGVKGYIFVCKALLGDYYTNHKAAGVGGSSQVTISPEWCVYSENEQLYIYKAFYTEIVDKSVMDKLKAKHKPQMAENSVMKIETFTEYLREASSPMYTNASTWTFIDGKIPVSLDNWVEFEDFIPAKFGPNVRLEYGQTGPMVVVDHNGPESEGFAVRYVEDIMRDGVLLRKFLGQMTDPNYKD